MGREYKTKVDWGEVEQEYVTGKTTLEDLADKYLVNSTTVSTRSSEGRWTAKRREYRKALKLGIEKGIQNVVIENEKTLNSEHYKIWGKLLKIIDEVLDNRKSELTTADGKVSINKLSQVAQIIVQTQGGQRLAVGIIEAAKLKELENADRRLDLEEIRTLGQDTPQIIPDTSFKEALTKAAMTVWESQENKTSHPQENHDNTQENKPE